MGYECCGDSLPRRAGVAFGAPGAVWEDAALGSPIEEDDGL
jgi:hypothetical protein